MASRRSAAAREPRRAIVRAAAERLLAAVAAPAFAARSREERETFWEALAALAPAQTLPRLREMLFRRRLFAQAKEIDDTACACAGLRRIGSPEAVALLREAAAAKRGEARELVERTLRALARARGAAAPAVGETEADRG
jgi:hypothetical protein